MNYVGRSPSRRVRPIPRLLVGKKRASLRFARDELYGELDSTGAIAKYYAARLGHPVLLSMNDEMMQVDVLSLHCYL